ncbi:MAG: hypothetical protein GXP57_06015 [Deltaproteobacteria bacterium]|nr:hypothetical protein [Deltaproteobacteria bacterium]
MSTEIATTGELFAQAWEQYKIRALPILAVMLISTVLVGGSTLVLVFGGLIGGGVIKHVTSGPAGAVLLFGVVPVLFLLVTALVFWSQTALLALIVNEEMGFMDALHAGWQYFRPMSKTISILLGIILIGLALGIVPGLIFIVWFSFSLFILIDEDRRGLDGLLASREYVRGHGWDTFFKLVLIWAISILAGIIPFAGQIFSFLFTPFLMLYLLAIYRNLKAVKGEKAVVTTGPAGRLLWSCLAGLGLMLPVVGLLALLAAVILHGQEWLLELQQLLPPGY